MTTQRSDQPAGNNPSSGSKADIHINPEWEIHPRDVRRMLDESAEFVLLDVRLEKEVQTARINGSDWVPLHELPGALAKLEQWRDKQIVVFCHHGKRSLQATAWRREQGFSRTHSMAGGIHAWSLLIDNRVPQY